METQPSKTSSKKRIAKLLDRSELPLYGAVEVSSDGNAILPHDFLPAHPKKLPEDWFYGTIGYWRYFDQTQRDKLGNVSAPPHLSLPTPDNVKKWQAKAMSVFGSTFHETGKYCYGMEMGRLAGIEGHELEGVGVAPAVSSIENVQDMLFERVAPKLFAEDNIDRVVATSWMTVYVPCLENNIQWLKDGFNDYAKTIGAKVELSEVMEAGKRVHSIIKLFKKYATQSGIRMFKNRQLKQWKFTIEVTKSRNRDGSLPNCDEGESWSLHQIEAYLDDTTKRMMCRNGRFEFLVKHVQSADRAGSVFTSNVREAAHRALQNGCGKEELEQRLINLRNLVRRMPADGKVLAAGVGDGYNADEARHSLGGEQSVARGEVGIGRGQNDHLFAGVARGGVGIGGEQNYDLYAQDLANITYAATVGDPSDLLSAAGLGSSEMMPMDWQGNGTSPTGDGSGDPFDFRSPAGTTKQQSFGGAQPLSQEQAPSVHTPPAGSPTPLSPPVRKHPPPAPPAVDPPSQKQAPPPLPSPPVGTPPPQAPPAIDTLSLRTSPRRQPRRSKLTDDQKKASLYGDTINARPALEVLEPFRVGELELYTSSGRRYPDIYCGLGRCHLRALFNVCKPAAQEAHGDKVKHTETDRVHSILKRHRRVANGEVFNVHESHWVALQRGDDVKENPMFFDDKVRLEVNNYEGASTALQLVEDMSASDFENVLHGKDAKRKTKTSAAQEKMKQMLAKQKQVRGLCIGN